MTAKTLKEYGLEYIDEMARDREDAQKQIGITILGAKNTILKPSGHISYKEIESFVDYTRKEVKKIIDGELNRITIKSLGRIRKVITSSGKTIIETGPDAVDSKEAQKKEDQKQEEISELTAEIHQLQKQISIVMHEKNAEIREREEDSNESRVKLKQYEDKFNENLLEMKTLNAKTLDLQEQNELEHKRLEQLTIQLQQKENLIQNLVEQNKLQEKDIENAISSVEEVYQTNEEFYQQSLNEAIKQSSIALEREFQVKLEDLENRLNQEKDQTEKVEKQYKNTIRVMEEELALAEEEKKKLRTSSIVVEQKGGDMVLDYTQRLLSTHPLYASMTILNNLGGSMPLPTLAKSVGAHPIKLRQMLEEIVEKGLLSISNDNPPVVAIVDVEY
ncbi:MAG: hypothetical protein ACXAC7_13185 [Candidatus Hodarchaeales archaeon]